LLPGGRITVLWCANATVCLRQRPHCRWNISVTKMVQYDIPSSVPDISLTKMLRDTHPIYQVPWRNMNEEMWRYSTIRNSLKQKPNTNYHQEVNWCNGTLHKRSKFECCNFFTFKCMSYKSRGLIRDVYCPTALFMFYSCWPKCVCQYK